MILIFGLICFCLGVNRIKVIVGLIFWKWGSVLFNGVGKLGESWLFC